MSTVQVDTINESTTGSGVTVDGVLIKDSAINASSVSGINRKNVIINGNFDIWQRGTSVTGQTSDQYLADRWYFVDSGATYSYQQGSFTVGQTDVPNNPKYFANLTITGADDSARLEQRIEDVYTFAGETVTLSFYAKYTSNAPTDFDVQIFQYFGSGGSTSVLTTAATGQTLTTSWQKFTYTISVPSISGKTVGSGSYLTIRPVINTNNETFDYQLAQVQVEKGSVATDFEIRPIGEELSLCQRYFYKTFAPEQTPVSNISNDNYIMVLGYTGAGSVSTSQQHPVQMASPPTITTFNPYAANSNARKLNSSTDLAITTISVNTNKLYFYISGTNAHSIHLHWTAEAEL